MRSRLRPWLRTGRCGLRRVLILLSRPIRYRFERLPGRFFGLPGLRPVPGDACRKSVTEKLLEEFIPFSGIGPFLQQDKEPVVVFLIEIESKRYDLYLRHLSPLGRPDRAWSLRPGKIR